MLCSAISGCIFTQADVGHRNDCRRSVGPFDNRAILKLVKALAVFYCFTCNSIS